MENKQPTKSIRSEVTRSSITVYAAILLSHFRLTKGNATVALNRSEYKVLELLNNKNVFISRTLPAPFRPCFEKLFARFHLAPAQKQQLYHHWL